MKKIILTALFSLIIVFFNSCNQSKINELNMRITNLQKDSCQLASENNLLKAKVDSIEKQKLKEDSIENKCKMGQSLVNYFVNTKNYFWNRGSIQSVKSSYQYCISLLEKMGSTIENSQKNEINKLIQSINEFSNKIDDYNSSAKMKMGANLWLALTKNKVNEIKSKLCK